MNDNAQTQNTLLELLKQPKAAARLHQPTAYNKEGMLFK